MKTLTVQKLSEILGITIKNDNVNKLITFLNMLSAYTEGCQFNISFNAPSSTGKSYIPLEISSLFPEQDVIIIGYCSPTAFFHDNSEYIELLKIYRVNFERKILVFLDQPHQLLLQHMRPILSHDRKEINLKITDKSQRRGLKTKNIVVRGYPSVIFCTAGLRMDEQETTRFFLLSPETNQDKIRSAITEKIIKDCDVRKYVDSLNDNPERAELKERIKAIKEGEIEDVIIPATTMISEMFFRRRILKPRHTRDAGRFISLVKSIALLNIWDKERKDKSIIATESDIKEAILLWDMISESQEYNLPPYVYNLFVDIILTAYHDKGSGITRQEIMQKHFEVYERMLPDWQLRQQILSMLETAGLISQEPDPNDKRKVLITPIQRYSE